MQLRASISPSHRRNYYASSVCASPRPDSLTHHADLDCDFACVLRKLSRDSQRPFSSPSFWHYFQVLVQNFLRLRRASVNFLSRLGPGSSPGRAKSQLASQLGELLLLGPRLAVVQQLPWPSAAATATGPMLLAAGELHGELQVQLARAAIILRAPSAAPPLPRRQQPMAMPPPPSAVPTPQLSSVLLQCQSVCRLSCLWCAHTLKSCVKRSNVRTWWPILAGLRPYFSAKNGK